MYLLSRIIVGIVGLLHFYFMWMEMFGWTTRAPKIFTKFPVAYFESTKALAANQGLYNGFLAVGLAWTFFIKDLNWQNNVSLFFLSCVAIAGIYGAYSVTRKIFFIQALPAIVGIVLVVVKR